MDTHDKHILVVDDSSVDLEIISIVCGALGCSVDVANNGSDAIGLFKQKRHMLVVTDYVMEPMDGISVISKIKQIDPRTSFLMVTGYPDNTAKVFVEENNLPEIVTKPISLNKMVETLAVALTQGSGYGGRRHIDALAARMNDCAALIGQSQVMQDLRDKLLHAVTNKFSILLLYGPDGVRKKEIARMLHYCGENARSHTVEHDFSAFTDADPLSAIIREDLEFGSILKEAKHGTLVLSGIETLSDTDQSKLFSFFPEISAHMRLILLDDHMLDLELNGLDIEMIEIPPLQAHLEDMPDIVRFIARSPIQFGLTRALDDEEISEIIDNLEYYDFEGNIMELIGRVRRLSDFEQRVW